MHWEKPLLCLVLMLLAACSSKPRHEPPREQPVPIQSHPLSSSKPEEELPAFEVAEGTLDVTFLVMSDPHFGARVAPLARSTTKGSVPVETIHKAIMSDMNHVEGRGWPGGLSGKVKKPLGLIVSGDLTDDGKPEQLDSFFEFYGKRLSFPLFEAPGNHDAIQGKVLFDRVGARHGSVFYSFNWHNLHVISLGESPDELALAWLEKDLKKARGRLPLVLYLHRPLLGPFSRGTWSGKEQLRDRLFELLEGQPVAGIFHGHYHASGHYRWKGFPVFNAGSVKHEWRTYLVVSVTDDRLRVAAWNYELGRWWWWWDGPMPSKEGKVQEGMLVLPDDPTSPVIPYPLRDPVH